MDRAVIHPRELVKQSLLTSAAAIILVHNHPSGLFDPSPEDRALTEAIIGCAKLFDIRVLDHIMDEMEERLLREEDEREERLLREEDEREEKLLREEDEMEESC